MVTVTLSAARSRRYSCALRAASALWSDSSSRQEAAEIAQIETKHWQLMESGGGNPTLATLIAVAKALGVEVYELLR
ncbi:MAG TPA: helix-turn-helix transcriptional regulator [Kofleriaceae bacterium]|jgi:DNA-binding phage protein|nr:helix-turn-helix transcriptional regulator [Kofleriaceae bacterium]